MKAVILLIVGLWLGLVLGLSFIEAPLKFTAPGMTVNLGLGIGRLVFGVLNKMEFVFSIIIMTYLCFCIRQLNILTMIIVGLVGIVWIQGLILLPQLDQRVSLRLAGETVRDSYHHITYVLMEASKLVLLGLLFFRVYTNPIIPH